MTGSSSKRRAPASPKQAAPSHRYKSSISTLYAWTAASQGDHAKIVNRPSWDATRATAWRWSCTNCAAARCRVPPDDLLDGGAAVPTANLGSEGVKLVTVGDHGRTVHGREPRKRVDCAADIFCPLVLGDAVVLLQDLPQFAERRLYGITNWTDDGLAPFVAVSWNNEKDSTPPMTPHRQRKT